MSFLSSYSRFLPQILCYSQLNSFYPTSSILKNLLPSFKPIIYTEPLRQFSFTTVHQCEKPLRNSERRKRAIIKKYPSRDRRIKIPVETSIRYMRSQAFKECYGDDPVWKHYRRNHKGGRAPRKTRKMCIRDDIVMTGNPCPICRDEYLVVHHENLDLLNHFISPTSGEIISSSKTGVCLKQQDKLVCAYLKAKDLGTITFNVPFRKYDYSEYVESQ